MAITIFGGMCLQWPLGKLSDIFQRRIVIIGISLLISLTSLALVFLHRDNFYYHLLLLFLFGGFAFSLYPISITYCCDFFSSAGITSVTSAALIIYGLGCIIGPISSPLLFMLLGPRGLFIYTSFLGLALFIFALWRQKKNPIQSEETKEQYQVHPGTTGKLMEKD